MKKIPTIFDRDWKGNKGVIDCWIEPMQAKLKNAVATEKLDGTNVRVTIRNGILVRLEKRRNPSKLQKAKGIEEPWYVDADENDPADKYLWEAVKGRAYNNDGEFSGEVLGKNIQGNPLKLTGNVICLFSQGEAPILEDAPISYGELKEWLPSKDSLYGNGKIEGIVWHCEDGSMYKIKTKDFK
jgi:hypothetical protein